MAVVPIPSVVVAGMLLSCSPLDTFTETPDSGTEQFEVKGTLGVAPSECCARVVILQRWAALGTTVLAPKPNVTVVFHNPDGSVRSLETTDEDGIARSAVAEGSMVTIDMSNTWLVTVADVNPGDVLTYAPDIKDYNFETVVRIAPTESAPDATDLSVSFAAGCTSLWVGGPAIVVPINVDVAGCSLTGAGRLNLMAYARDSEDNVVATAVARDIEVTSELTEVSLSTWRTPVSRLVGGTSIVAGADNAQVRYWPTRGGQHYGPLRTDIPLSGSNTGWAQVLYPWPFSQTATVAVEVVRGTSKSVLVREIGTDLTVTLNADDFFPQLESIELDAATPARPSANWHWAGGTPEWDSLKLDMDFEQAGNQSWHAHVPPNAQTFTFPELPAALAARAPASTESITSITATHTDRTDSEGHTDYMRKHFPESPNEFERLGLSSSAVWSAE